MEEYKNNLDINDILYDNIFIKKRNIGLFGVGGCGKSFIIKKIKKYCDDNKIKCGLTSTTGVSSYNIEGVTIHSWSGIKLGTESVKKIVDEMFFTIKNNWKDTKILIIDEISMLGKNTFELLSEVGKCIRNINKPFGDIQLILTGDCLQLPPINDDFVFESEIWNQLNLIYFEMTTPYRYKDINFFEMLKRIRINKINENDIKILESRLLENHKNKFLNENDIKPTVLFSLRKDVENMNLNELQKLKSIMYTYDAKDIFNSSQKKFAIEQNKKILDNFLPRKLYLKKYAQVMLLVNLNVGNGLYNGSRGIIEDCNQNEIKVRFINNIIIDIVPYTYKYKSGNIVITRQQYPLQLAYSSTIHKSQGLTLDYVIVDLGNTLFSENMGYVSLSRCRNLDGIFISNLNVRKIKASKKALNFEKILNEKTIKIS